MGLSGHRIVVSAASPSLADRVTDDALDALAGSALQQALAEAGDPALEEEVLAVLRGETLPSPGVLQWLAAVEPGLFGVGRGPKGLDVVDELDGIFGLDRAQAEETRRLRDAIVADLGLAGEAPEVIVGTLEVEALGLSTPGQVWLAPTFDPRERTGQALLAHELTHEAQRRMPAVEAHATRVAAAEHEAEAVMGAVLRGGSAWAPTVALPAQAEAACGPQAMAEAHAKEAEKKKPGKKKPDPEPEEKDKIPQPIPPGPVPPKPPEPKFEPEPKPVPPPPTVVVEPPPAADLGGDCAEPCPDPLPEHLSDAPVKTPAAAPKGEGDERTLTLAGHTIHFRLPKNAKPGQVRITFREVDSPYGALTLKRAVVTLGKDLEITHGQLHVDVHLGSFINAPDVVLTVAAGGQVAAKIRDARVQIGSIVRGKVDLDIGPDGISGAGIFTARDIALGGGIKVADGRLDVRVSKGGAVTAHGLLALEVGDLGRVELEACFVDGELAGRLTVIATKAISIGGVAKIRRIELSGCYHKEGWSLHGELDVSVRDWLSATVTADVSRDAGGALAWVVAGELRQDKPINLGALAIHDAQMRVRWNKTAWDKAEGDVHYQAPNVMGELKGALDVAKGTISGHGAAEVTSPIAVGPISLDEGQLDARIEDNALVEIIGAATVSLAYEGIPTFEVRCDEAIYDVAEAAIHARGAMTMLRELRLGTSDGLHATIAAGPAGAFAIEHGALVNLATGLAVQVAHGESAIGNGNIAFNYSEAAGIGGSLDFALTGRTGLPSFAAGPLFLLPGGRFAVVVAAGVLGSGQAQVLQWELLNPTGVGRLCGEVSGAWDFGTGAADLHGTAWVHEPWVQAAGPLALTFLQGGEARIAATQDGISELAGKLAFEVAVTTAALGAFTLKGNVDGSLDPTTGVATGAFAASLAEGSELRLPAVGAFEVVATAGSKFSGALDANGIAGPVALDFQFEVRQAGAPKFAGAIEGASCDMTQGSITGAGSVSALEDMTLLEDRGEMGWGLALVAGSRLAVEVADNVLKSGDFEADVAATRGGVRVASVGLAGTWQLGDEASLDAQLDGAARVVVEQGFTVFEAGPYALGFAPSAFVAILTGGEITSVDGIFGLFCEQRGGPDEAPLGSLTAMLNGSYRSNGGAGVVDGIGELAVQGELRVADAGDYALHITSGSSASVTFAKNRISKLDGALTGRVDLAAPGSGETAQFLAIDGDIHYRPEDGGRIDARAFATMLGRRRIADFGERSLWLAPGLGPTGASIVIEDNAVVSLDGRIGAEVHDAGGALFEVGVQGQWSAEGALRGAGEARLLRSLSWPEGATSGPRIEVMAGSRGSAAVADNRLEDIEGELAVTVYDHAGAVIGIGGTGRIDVGRGMLVEATGQVALLRAIEIGGEGSDALVRIDSLSAEGVVRDGVLEEANGSLAFVLPRLSPGGKPIGGTLQGGWALGKDGEPDAYWGRGTLDLPLVDDPASGRKLTGAVTVEVDRDGSWRTSGQLDFELMEGVGGKVDVAMDESLDPVIGMSFTAEATLIEGRTLFERQLELVPRMSVGAPPVMASFGVSAGLGLKMDDFVGRAEIEAEGWRPLGKNAEVAPNFNALLEVSGGLDLHAVLAAYLQVELGAGGLANIHAGIRAELGLDLPVTFNPSGRLWGGPDGVGGSLDIGLKIAPKLSLDIIPYIGGEILFMEVGNMDFAGWSLDLGEPFAFEWGTSYGFGDAPANASAPITTNEGGGAPVQQPVSHVLPPSFPTSVGAAPTPKKGLPAIEGEPGQTGIGGALGGAGGEGKAKLDQMSQAIAALGRVGSAAGAYIEAANPTSMMANLATGHADLVAAWEHLAAEGRVLFAACEGLFGSLRYSVPMWVRLIIEAPPGATPSALEAWNQEDEVARLLIAGGFHGALPLAGRVQLVEALLRGSCGDLDENAILELLEHARVKGDLQALLGEVGVERIVSNINGDERTKLVAFFAKAGVDSSLSGDDD